MTDLAPLSTGPLPKTARALTDRLKLVFPPTLFTHRFMPAKLTAKDWMQLTQRTPFVGLGWTEIEPIDTPDRDIRGESRWTVFLVAKNAAGIEARYFGDERAPGLFSMVQAAAALLHGFTIDGAGSASVTKIGNLYAEGWDADDSAIAGIDVSVGFDMTLPEAVANIEADWLLTFGIAWTFDDAVQLNDVVNVGTV